MRAYSLLLLLAFAGPSLAGEKAGFIDGTYVMNGRCEAWRAIRDGGPMNVETVPETLTADGFRTWEGGCSFSSIKEIEPGRRWLARMSCTEAAEEWVEEDTFELDATTGKITVTVEGKASQFERCDG